MFGRRCPLRHAVLNGNVCLLEETSARPVISVVIPSRNRRPLLFAVLEALGRQTEIAPNTWEAVVVLDGSDDDTEKQLEGYRPPYGLDVISQVHLGVATARNRGWQRASADLILFLDDDVIPAASLLSAHVKAHAAQPGAAVVLGRVIPGHDVSDAWNWYDGWTMARKYAALATTELPSGIHFGGNFSLRRASLVAVGGFDRTLPRGEHVDLGYRLAGAGVRFVYAPAAEARHVGQRDFVGWQTSYRLDGRMDVALYRDRGYAGGVSTLVATYHDRHPLNRLVLRLVLGRRSPERWAVLFSAAIGSAAHRLGIRHAVRFAYSAAANVAYWGGVRDGLRGTRALWRAVADTRQHRARPYRLRGGLT